MIEFGKELSDRGRPETFENLIIFFGTDALIDDFGSGGIVGNTMTHESFINKGEGAFLLVEGFPGMPVYVAFEAGFEDIVGAIIDDKSDSRTTNGITKTEDLPFHKFSFEGFFEFDWGE